MSTQTIKIECQCGTLFGVQDDEGNFNKKHRDMYLTVEKGGKCWGPCRRCGRRVEWPK